MTRFTPRARGRWRTAKISWLLLGSKFSKAEARRRRKNRTDAIQQTLKGLSLIWKEAPRSFFLSIGKIGVELYVAQCDIVSGWTLVKGLIAFNTEAYTVRGRKRKSRMHPHMFTPVSKYTMYYRLIIAPKAEILHRLWKSLSPDVSLAPTPTVSSESPPIISLL